MKCLKINGKNELNLKSLRNMTPASCSAEEEAAVLKFKGAWHIHYRYVAAHHPHYEGRSWYEESEKYLELQEEKFILYASRPAGYLAGRFLILFDDRDTHQHRESSSVNHGPEAVEKTWTWTLVRKTHRFLAFQENDLPPMKSLLRLGSTPAERIIKVDRNKKRQYAFYLVTVDRDFRSETGSKLIFSYSVMPASAPCTSLLKITYTPNGSFQLMLTDQAGRKDITHTPYRFNDKGECSALI